MKIKFFIYLFIISLNLPLNVLAEESFYKFNADNISYINQEIIAEGNAIIYDEKGKKFFANKIIYNKLTGIVKTIDKSKFVDELGNQITTKDLIYNSKTGDLKSNKNTEVTDTQKNLYIFSDIFYNTITKNGHGENFNGTFVDGSNVQAKKIFFDLNSKKSTYIESKYTTCLEIKNKQNQYCPWWSLSTSKTLHDINKKTIVHKNALLKIKKLPILYLPYIEHPDPTVKRQSGILLPRFKKLSSSGNTFGIPYFWAIKDEMDATITPIYYFKENPLFLTEFRKKNKDSMLIIDSSYTSGYKNTNIIGRNKGSRNHFYLNYVKNIRGNYFNNNKIDLQIQKVSQENYLKLNQINTLLAKENDKKLESKIQLIAQNNFSLLDLSGRIFEDLNKNGNDKYEYVFPYGNYYHNLTKFNQNINFQSDFISRKYNNNSDETKIINQINTFSNPKIFNKFGSNHIFKTKFSNINQYFGNNQPGNKDSINSYLTVALDSTLPLYKKNKNIEQSIIPRFFIKYTTGQMESARGSNKILYYSDVFSMDRSIDQTNPETGLSFGSGVEYEISRKNVDNNVYLKNTMGFGQVFRTSRLEQMPIQSSLDNKQSNFAGYYNLSYLGDVKKELNNKKIDFLEKFKQNKTELKYNFNLSKNFSNLDQSELKLEGTFFNKINANINFNEKNNYAGNERKVEYEYNFLINKKLYLNAKIIDNLNDNFKESERIGLQYENDCIKLGLFMKKEYYQNIELSNNKSIFFNIIIKPFSNEFSPDLSGFVN